MEIKEKELLDFCRWYKEHHGEKSERNVFDTALCGYFHVSPKEAKQMVRICKHSMIVREWKGFIRIVR